MLTDHALPPRTAPREYGEPIEYPRTNFGATARNVSGSKLRDTEATWLHTFASYPNSSPPLVIHQRQ